MGHDVVGWPEGGLISTSVSARTCLPWYCLKSRKTALEAMMQLGNGDAATRPSLLRSRAGKDA
jgi:hypothetical protein